MMTLDKLRQAYHRRICLDIVRVAQRRLPTSSGHLDYPNFADGSSNASTDIAWGVVDRLGYVINHETISGQTAGRLFEEITKEFVQKAFELVQHLRPGRWQYSLQRAISDFDQYDHLSDLEKAIERDRDLASALGTDYIVKPDIVIGREPVSDVELNQRETVLEKVDSLAQLTPLREISEVPNPILHASISCKWTLRSDRAQNARAEALNLIRHRKGNLPHVVAVTAEPLPTRLAALALGTGDMDCVYHFALYELEAAIRDLHNEDQLDTLKTLIDGRRLRDISDLPFDLAI